MKVFLSYGHDRNTPIVLRIKGDLEAAGHIVWIDSSEIKVGDDWRRSIVDGIMGADWTLGFLSRHSVRNPGVCLDELAIALHLKGGSIATILLESEAASEPPISLSQIQWLDMHDWAERMVDHSEAGENWYRSKLGEILGLLADPKIQQFKGEIKELDRKLQPISQEAEIGTLVDDFIGREWLQSALDEWCRNDRDSRLFWISGAPGTGKSAFAAWLAHKSRLNVVAVNFCRYNLEERRDPARILCTIAFQIASRLPDYRRLLLDRLSKEPDEQKFLRKGVPALFDWLLVEPLRFAIGGGRQRERFLIVIDALDETIREGRSALAEVLAESCHKFPDWIAVVVTGRPEPSILRQFAGFKPRVIATESTENLNDLRTYVRRWLAIESRGAGETEARVERTIAAAQGNFLYLRKLRDAVSAGLMDLNHPDGLPQGLIGLYERWFQRQFLDAAIYERIRPLLEVLVAANHPIPEKWLRRSLGWSADEHAQMLESLGSLVVQIEVVGSLTRKRWGGISPFHKSLRDWLTDWRSSGAEFQIDAAAGLKRLIAALQPVFESSCKSVQAVSDLPPFVLDELIFLVTHPQAEPANRNQFIQYLSDPQLIRRLMRIDTDADEDTRRRVRHDYRDLVERIATLWPSTLDAKVLWSFVTSLNDCAWSILADDYGPRGIIIWEQCQPPALAGQMQEVSRRNNEWNEAILVLLTALDIATIVVTARRELAPSLAGVMDERLREFLGTAAGGIAYDILGWTSGREYYAERNLSFLRGSAETAFRQCKTDPRLAAWALEWSHLLDAK